MFFLGVKLSITYYLVFASIKWLESFISAEVEIEPSTVEAHRCQVLGLLMQWTQAVD
ncbi:hypothetical protein Hanom_Chr03g00199831 [Helianthus anomalus]